MSASAAAEKSCFSYAESAWVKAASVDAVAGDAAVGLVEDAAVELVEDDGTVDGSVGVVVGGGAGGCTAVASTAGAAGALTAGVGAAVELGEAAVELIEDAAVELVEDEGLDGGVSWANAAAPAIMPITVMVTAANRVIIQRGVSIRHLRIRVRSVCLF